MKPDSLFFRLRGVIALVLLLCFVAAFVLSACGSPYQVQPSEDRSVRVLAAHSTEPALERLSADLYDRGSGISAEIDYLDAGALLGRANSEHQADIVVTASREHMQELTEDGLIKGDPLPLASNRLVLVATPQNPQSIKGFNDFAARAADLSVSTCAEDAPCTEQITDLSGTFGLELEARDMTLASAGGAAEPESALTALTAGRSDAALAYVTDVLARDTPLQTFEIPGFHGSTTQVWAGVLDDPEDDAAAEEFLGVMAGERARSAFSEAGFLPPPAAEAGAGSD
ncbi:molybdate ABC transporter substrate-binding protein [Nesterenkonia lutea]|uniref:Molybdate transport system substrate-binding protein n=1 Tax=Nesterenkonia lutea TaxID=272919 RepID=A0ABR9JBL0_9MICC|nr:substrate-binding domain-containing protein [Nesterenkonia lutea]MBE1523314.1 molybdate transport system substrate-binding protein [Nesterenkonia lutea]